MTKVSFREMLEEQVQNMDDFGEIESGFWRKNVVFLRKLSLGLMNERGERFQSVVCSVFALTAIFAVVVCLCLLWYAFVFVIANTGG